MNHADPWDEIVRLESEMEVELLAALEEARVKHRKGIAVSERIPSGAGRFDPEL
jgi:hypothetical protein